MVEGERPPLAAQDRLVAPSDLERVDGMVDLAFENQGNWTVRAPLHSEDPPAYSDAAMAWNDEPGGGEFEEVAPRLSEVLGTLALQEAVMSAQWVLMGLTSAEELIAAPLSPLWIGGLLVHGEPTHDVYRVDGHPDALVLVGVEGVWVGANRAPPSTFLRDGAPVHEVFWPEP